MRKIVKEKIKCFTADDERVAILHSGRYIILDDNDHVISNAYDYIEATEDGEHWYIEEGELSGILNSKGEVIIYPGKYKFDDPYYSNGLLLVIKDELHGYIDEEGNLAIPLKYEEAKAFDGGLAIVRFKGKAGIIDTTGSIVGEIKYDEVYSFQEDLYPVKLNEKWGFINKQGQEMIPLIYDQVYKFHEGLAGVRKGTKWGFIDHEGNEVIPFGFDLVWDFKDGKAKVKKNNQEYFIDKTGKERYMENKEFINMITPIIQGIELNEKNREFIEYINQPLGFYNSKPEKFGKSSDRNKGETEWQRVLYNEEPLWLDMELPIGQYKKEPGKTCNKRLDLIGRQNDKYILCELKKTKKPGQPFDALLQLVAYYFMIKNNAEVLDAMDIHHKSSEVRDENFKWSEIKNNIELWLRANKEFWDNFDKNTLKNNATKAIIKLLKEKKLIVRLFSENDEILI